MNEEVLVSMARLMDECCKMHKGAQICPEKVCTYKKILEHIEAGEKVKFDEKRR